MPLNEVANCFLAWLKAHIHMYHRGYATKYWLITVVQLPFLHVRPECDGVRNLAYPSYQLWVCVCTVR